MLPAERRMRQMQCGYKGFTRVACSDEVRRMQKSLEQMNIKIHVVISDILGKTGMQILEAIIAGNHDPEDLSGLRDPRIKASREDIIISL